MQYDYVVVMAFGAHRIGERISDPEAIALIVGSEQFFFVVRVAHVDDSSGGSSGGLDLSQPLGTGTIPVL